MGTIFSIIALISQLEISTWPLVWGDIQAHTYSALYASLTGLKLFLYEMHPIVANEHPRDFKMRENDLLNSLATALESLVGLAMASTHLKISPPQLKSTCCLSRMKKVL